MNTLAFNFWKQFRTRFQKLPRVMGIRWNKSKKQMSLILNSSIIWLNSVLGHHLLWPRDSRSKISSESLIFLTLTIKASAPIFHCNALVWPQFYLSVFRLLCIWTWYGINIYLGVDRRNSTYPTQDPTMHAPCSERAVTVFTIPRNVEDNELDRTKCVKNSSYIPIASLPTLRKQESQNFYFF